MKRILLIIAFIVILSGCSVLDSEDFSSSYTYNGIEYDRAYQHRHRGGFIILVFDEDSNACLKIGKNQISKKISYSEMTYTGSFNSDEPVPSIYVEGYGTFYLAKDGSISSSGVDYDKISVLTALSYIKD